MPQPKLSKLELQILEALWAQGKASVREILEAFPEPLPAYTTIQTTVYRLEGKKALRRVRKISNADIFEATISREDAQGTLIDELLALLGGRAKPVMAHFVKSGKLTLDDVKEAEKALRKTSRSLKLLRKQLSQLIRFGACEQKLVTDLHARFAIKLFRGLRTL